MWHSASSVAFWSRLVVIFYMNRNNLIMKLVNIAQLTSKVIMRMIENIYIYDY